MNKKEYCWPSMYKFHMSTAANKPIPLSDLCTDCMQNGFDDFQNGLNRLECLNTGGFYCLRELRDLKKLVDADPKYDSKGSDYCKRGCNRKLPSEMKKVEETLTYEKIAAKSTLRRDRYLSEEYCGAGGKLRPGVLVFVVALVGVLLAAWKDELVVSK